MERVRESERPARTPTMLQAALVQLEADLVDAEGRRQKLLSRIKRAFNSYLKAEAKVRRLRKKIEELKPLPQRRRPAQAQAEAATNGGVA